MFDLMLFFGRVGFVPEPRRRTISVPRCIAREAGKKNGKRADHAPDAIRLSINHSEMIEALLGICLEFHTESYLDAPEYTDLIRGKSEIVRIWSV